jgi:phospholipase C
LNPHRFLAGAGTLLGLTALVLAPSANGGAGGGSPVSGPPSYSLNVAPLSSGLITAGKTSTATITVTATNGYTGNVHLSCRIESVSATAPSCSLSSSSVALARGSRATSVLTVSASSNTLGGTYTLSVAGRDANNLASSNGAQTRTVTMQAAIQHIVIIFQENRTPDNLFQDPVLIARGADIAHSGVNSHGQTIALTPIDLGTTGAAPSNYDLHHSHAMFLAMYDSGKMDGADRVGCAPAANCPANSQFKYVIPADVQPYFALAEQYAFGDRMFQTNQGPSYPAHQFIFSATSTPTEGSPLFAAENPTPLVGSAGCIAPLTQTVVLIDASGSEKNARPIYPCYEHPTLTDLMQTNGVTWRYYTPSAVGIFTGPSSIAHICQEQTINSKRTCTGAEWTNNVVIPQSKVLTDIAKGKLAQVTWVMPGGLNSDHASSNDGSGPSWVASIVNAIGTSPYWANTAIIITWDDWGGWYDHVAPKVVNDGVSWGSGYVYGFRVPLIVVSPYAKASYISHVTHDFGSILKFVESTFNLSSLGYADGPADDLSDCFNFTQAPRPFHKIPAALKATYFINDKRPPTDPDDE